MNVFRPGSELIYCGSSSGAVRLKEAAAVILPLLSIVFLVLGDLTLVVFVVCCIYVNFFVFGRVFSKSLGSNLVIFKSITVAVVFVNLKPSFVGLGNLSIC